MRERLSRILQALPCGVLVAEADGQVSLANPETRRLLGFACDSSLPRWVRDLLDRAPGDRSKVEHHCGNPEAEWITVRRAQLSAEEGGSAIFILQDVSDLKRLEREREALSRREALAEMSALLAHEIRNPLGSLELFAGLLAECDLEAEEKDWVGQLQSGLRTLAATVNNVLHFHGQPAAGRQPTDLGQWLRSTREFLRPLAQRAGVRLELAQELDGLLVAADRHRLEQVLLNLALNAFRFMPDGGVLSIRGEISGCAEGRVVVVEVSDTGPGIAGEDRERIFQPGFTSCVGESRPGVGGVQSHHGTARRRHHRGPPVGPGTTFRLEFPLGGAIA